MKIIKLTQGKKALIDDEDYDLVSQYKWWVLKDRNNWYACATLRNQTFYMHRLIMDAQKGIQIDHKNHNGLDNQKSNLRFATHSQQRRNMRKRGECSSKFKGVCWHKKLNKWQAYIRIPYCKSLGLFKNEENAAKAYDKAAKEHFGEFACLNFR